MNRDPHLAPVTGVFAAQVIKPQARTGIDMHGPAFREALPLLLRGEDPAFKRYIKRVAQEERGATVLTPSS